MAWAAGIQVSHCMPYDCLSRFYDSRHMRVSFPTEDLVLAKSEMGAAA